MNGLELAGKIREMDAKALFVFLTNHMIGTVGAILCIIQCLVLVLAIFPTERALKRTFTEEGIKR